MSEMSCRYCKDEFCVNDQCPLRADYCPVPDTPGVCRYEERVKNPLTPKECLAAAFDNCSQEMRESEIEELFESLTKILCDNGWEIHPANKSNEKIDEYTDVNNVSNKTEQYLPGQVVNLHDVEKSADWKLVSVATDPFDTACTYVSKDDKFIVRFPNDAVVATTEWRYCHGQSVHVGVIGESPYWKYEGERNDATIYKSTDKTMFVAFKRESDWGVVRRSTEIN
jgi:hypothetical protein